MLAEISAGLTGLNAAKQIIQGLDAIRTETALNEVKINLQGFILEAHQGLFAAQQAQATDAARIAELEQEIMRLKDWSAEREKYELKALGRGSFAYMLKAPMRGTEPAHWLCTQCYTGGKKAIMQLQGQHKAGPRDVVHACPSCQANFATANWVHPKYDAEEDFG